MATDKRKKCCPNESCERHEKKIMLKPTEEYCPKCGTKLIFVCPKCFREIEDIDPKHRICKHCEAEGQEKKERIVDGAKKAGKVVVSPVVFGIVNGVIKDGQKGAIKNGVKIVEKVAAKVVFKK